MKATTNQQFEFIKQHLQVIALQNKALQLQISSFNETLQHNLSQINTSNQILKNTIETTLKSRQINDLINKCKSELESFISQKQQIQSLKTSHSFISQHSNEFSCLSFPKNEQPFLTQNRQALKNPIEAIACFLPPQIETNCNESRDFLPQTQLSQTLNKNDFLVVTLGAYVAPIQTFISNPGLKNPLEDPFLSLPKPTNSVSAVHVTFDRQTSVDTSISHFYNSNFPPFEKKLEKLSTVHKSELNKPDLVFNNPQIKQPSNFPISNIFKNEKTYPVQSVPFFCSDTFENLPLDKICEEDYPKYRQMFQDHLLRRKRGKYKICTSQMKEQIVRICQNHSLKTAAEIFSVPEKNIKRWITQGPERKKGAGRKTMDPQMESGLLNWISEFFRIYKVFPDFKEIKLQAKRFTKNETFMASKGWCDKFMKRNVLFFQKLRDQKYQCV